MKILCKHTHFYISTVMLSYSKENKPLQSCTGKHFSKLISSQFFDSAIFIPELQVPQPSKISNNVSSRTCSFYGDMPVVPPEHIIRHKCGLSMHNFTAVIVNVSYMFQLQSGNHQAVYVRSINRNFISVVHI